MSDSTYIHDPMLSETQAYRTQNYTTTPPYGAPSEVVGGLTDGLYGHSQNPILPQQFGVSRGDISWTFQETSIPLGAPTETSTIAATKINTPADLRSDPGSEYGFGIPTFSVSSEASTIDAPTINTPADLRSDPGSEYRFGIPTFSLSSEASYIMGNGYSQYGDTSHLFHSYKSFIPTNGRIDQQSHMIFKNSLNAFQTSTIPAYGDGLHGTGTWASADPAHEQFSDPNGEMIHNPFMNSPVPLDFENSPFDWSDQPLSQAIQFPAEASLLTSQDNAASHMDGPYNDDVPDKSRLINLINPDAYASNQSPVDRENLLFNDFSVQQFGTRGTSNLPALNIPSTSNGKQILLPSSQIPVASSECSSYRGNISSQRSTPQSTRNHSPLSENSPLAFNGPHPTPAKSPSVKSTSSKTSPWLCTCGTIVTSARLRDIERHRSKCKVNPNDKELKCHICEHVFQFGRNDRLRKHVKKEHPGHS